MENIRLSAVILTKNNDSTIEKCIRSVSFCDEVLAIDDMSTDNTKIMLEKLGARVISRRMEGNFSDQRNEAMQNARGEWILFLDSDEVVSEDLEKEIIEVVNATKADAYYIRRRDWFWGTDLKYGEVSKARRRGIIRLVKKNSGKWKGMVHEVFDCDGKTTVLSGYLEHYPHQTIRSFLREINTYSTIRAKELLDKGEKPTILKLLLYPPAKFMLTYFFYLGFRDGIPGFVYSFVMSFHSFLVRAKHYQYSVINK